MWQSCEGPPTQCIGHLRFVPGRRLVTSQMGTLSTHRHHLINHIIVEISLKELIGWSRSIAMYINCECDHDINNAVVMAPKSKPKCSSRADNFLSYKGWKMFANTIPLLFVQRLWKWVWQHDDRSSVRSAGNILVHPLKQQLRRESGTLVQKKCWSYFLLKIARIHFHHCRNNSACLTRALLLFY